MLLVGGVVMVTASQVFGPGAQAGPSPPRSQTLTEHIAGSASPAEAPSVPSGPTATTSRTSPPPAPAVASTAVPPAPPAPAVSEPRPATQTTVASWYGQRPLACFDPGQRHPLPSGLVMWVASRTLACGTAVQVSGPAGSAVLLVEDRGPYLHPGRDLDLSPEAFRRIVGPLSTGLAQVTYRLDRGAAPNN
jgi:rare lipoprotein A (peptidoglycan hydrolase)